MGIRIISEVGKYEKDWMKRNPVSSSLIKRGSKRNIRDEYDEAKKSDPGLTMDNWRKRTGRSKVR